MSTELVEIIYEHNEQYSWYMIFLAGLNIKYEGDLKTLLHEAFIDRHFSFLMEIIDDVAPSFVINNWRCRINTIFSNLY